jgi:hypothetical protein
MPVRNGNAFHNVCIVSIQIRTLDVMTHTLTRVEHMPTMAIKLIPHSTLYGDGYKNASGRRLLKVPKGSLIHMRGDMIYAKLYEVALCMVLLLLLFLMNPEELISGICVLDI